MTQKMEGPSGEQGFPWGKGEGYNVGNWGGNIGKGLRDGIKDKKIREQEGGKAP